MGRRRNKVQDVNGNQLQASPSQRESCCLLLLPAVRWLCHTLRLAQCNTLCFLVNTSQVQKQPPPPKKTTDTPPKKIKLNLLSPPCNISTRDSGRAFKASVPHIWRRFPETAWKTSVGSSNGGLLMQYMYLLLWNLLLQSTQ